MSKKRTCQTKMYMVIPIFLLFGQSLFQENVQDGPEQLKDTGLYTLEEELFYHKDFLINDLLQHYNKYTLTRLNEFMNTGTVYRQGAISPLPQKLNPAIGGIVTHTPRYGDISLDDWITRSSNQGFLVIHKGCIVYERYDKMADYQWHAWMSVTKTLVGLAMHILHDQGLIDFDEPVKTYLPNYKNSAYGKTKIRDIMNMSSGILTNDHVTSSIVPYFKFKNTSFTSGLHRFFRLLPRSKPGGKEFNYSSVDTIVLTMIVETVSQMTLSRFLTEHVWVHIGAEHDAAIGLLGVTMGKGHPVGGGLGLMMSTLRDLGRYGMLYTPSWSKISKVNLFSQNHRAELLDKNNKPDITPFLTNVIGHPDLPKGDAGFGVGDVPVYNASQWDMIFADGDMLKMGVGGQGLYVSYTKDLVIAYFSYNDYPMEFAHSYARAIAHYMENEHESTSFTH